MGRAKTVYLAGPWPLATCTDNMARVNITQRPWNVSHVT